MPEWLEVGFDRYCLSFFFFSLLKALGKKQISQLSFFEYITGITIGSIAGESIMGLDGRFFRRCLGIVIVAFIPFLVGLISLKSKKFRDFTEGKGTIFIKDGKVMEDNLKKERYTVDELLGLLRNKDVFQVSDVEYADFRGNR